ncbi:porin family protein [Prevotella sp. 10(H)]|uniref:porin family protein n=1 Tax=Prevotella sp. 10(H) TaxID=1158294 RepID=UPI001E373971|nr:porin family protein [Prevotella sp. 10(H)]
MKNKIIIILLALITFSTNILADDGDDKKGLDWYLNLGLNMGGSMPVPLPREVRKIESYNPKINPHIGISTVYNLNRKWGVGTELSLGIKGMRVKDRVKYMQTKVLVSEKGNPNKSEVDGYFTGKNTTNVNLQYLSLSLYGIYNIGSRWEVKGGVYAASILKSKFEGNVSDGYLRDKTPNGPIVVIEADNPATFDFEDNMRDFDAGFVVGGRYKINERIGVMVNMNLGLTDIFYRDQNPINFKMQNIYGTFGVTYKLK